MSESNTQATDIDQPATESNVVVDGPGLNAGYVNIETYFTIHSLPGTHTVSIVGPSGNLTHDTYMMDCNHQVKFTPTEPGHHVIRVTKDDKHVSGSPFSLQVCDSLGAAVRGVTVSGPGLTEAVAGQSTHIVISPLEHSTYIPCKAKLWYNNRSNTLTSVVRGDGTRIIHFTPSVCGVHTLKVTFDGVGVPGSPFTIDVAWRECVEGPGILSATVGVETYFDINTRVPGNFVVTVCNPNLVLARRYNVLDTLRCEYTPETTGQCIVAVMRVTPRGQISVTGSPFTLNVQPNSAAVDVSIPVSDIQNLLLSYKDMPVPTYQSLAQKLLAEDRYASIQLVLNNIMDASPDSLARLEILLRGGIKLFQKSGHRTNENYISVFALRCYPGNGDIQRLLIEYLMCLSGDDLEDARTAFKKYPNNVPIHRQHENQEQLTKLCIHIQAIPDSVRDPVVILDCARAGVFQARTEELTRQCLQEIAAEKNAMCALTAERDALCAQIDCLTVKLRTVQSVLNDQ